MSLLEANDCYKTQFLFGLNHWLDRNQDMHYFSPLGTPGLALGDMNVVVLKPQATLLRSIHRCRFGPLSSRRGWTIRGILAWD